MKNNARFGKILDQIKLDIDNHFEKRPKFVHEGESESGLRCLNKPMFLSKFSCFDGYMEYMNRPVTCKAKGKGKGKAKAIKNPRKQ